VSDVFRNLRAVFAAVSFAVSPTIALAGEIDSFGVRMTLPVSTEESSLWKREIDTKSPYMIEVEETQGYTLPGAEGSRLVVSTTALGMAETISKSFADTVKLRDGVMASAQKEFPKSKIETIEIDAAPGYRFVTVLEKDGKAIGNVGSLTLFVPGYMLRVRVYAPDDSVSQDALLGVLNTVAIDRVRISAMLAEADAIKKASVTGTTVNTSIGQFSFPSGTRPSLLSLKAERDRFAGMTIATTFLAARDGFWSSQRTVATFMCLPTGSDLSKDEFAEGLRKDESISQLKVSPTITTGRYPLRRYDYRQSAKGTAMDVTTWMVQGPQQTLGVMMLGFYNEGFRNQLEKSVSQSDGKCQSIPGARAE